MRVATTVVVASSLIASLSWPAAAARRSISTTRAIDRQRAVATYAALQARFYSPASHLYKDSGPGAAESSAAAWSYSQAFAATLAVARIHRFGARYRSAVADRMRGLSAYWDRQRQPQGYDAAVVRGGQAQAARFYDDNAWLGLDLVDSWDLLHTRSALVQATRVFTLVRSGWDTTPSDSCPGGVFWTHWRGIADRNTVSTVNGALLALRLYRETGSSSYLTWARRMYDWVAACLTRPDGLIADHIRGDGTIDEHAWTYNQGAMIAAATLLYEATGDRRLQSQAETLATRALTHFGGDYQNEPPIFVAIFFRDLLQLNQMNPDPRYQLAIQAYADRAWDSSRVSAGSALFGLVRPPTILDQAAMVQIYADLAAAE